MNRNEVKNRLRAVACDVVEEFGLTNAFDVTEVHVNAAYIQLWDWDRFAVEMLTDHAAVLHAIQVAVADKAPAATGTEPF